MKTCVVCYSRFGHTAVVARALARELGAELRRIESVRQHGFMGMGFRAVFDIRMALKPMDLDFSGFDRVVLCAPIWAGKLACPARTFLREAKLEGRRLAVVFTCAGGEVRRALELLRKDIAGRNIEFVAYERVVTDKANDTELERAGLSFAARLGTTA
ncbi:MAG: hypothetical protein ABIK86_04835 [candidate division WOR-3 bacterium]